ncbi:MAG: DUF2283 domain-containing protein [Gammaproteobacteria bacterium]|nr:DUF2283 domain-containing protein [Gammaproteobacteria bacterium]
MKTDYDATDDILVLHFTDKPVSREVSQDWNLNIAYADDRSIVEIVIIDAKASGARSVHLSLQLRDKQ